MSTPRVNDSSYSSAFTKKAKVYLPIEVEGIPYNITIECIGTGAFGSVNIVVPADENNALSKQLCAKIQISSPTGIKQIREKAFEVFDRKVKTELTVLKALKRGFGDVIQKPHSTQKKEKIIIMEYFPGLPLDKLKESLSFQQRRHIMFGSIQEVITLHTLTPDKYFHNDIRPGNFLYNANTGDVRLIDFGNSSTDTAEWSDPGAMAFLAPERRLRGQAFATEKTDMYSLAITFAELFGFGYQDGDQAMTMRFVWKEWDQVAHEANESEQAEQKLIYYYLRYVMAADNPEDRPVATKALQILQDPVELKNAVGAFIDQESKQTVDVLIDPNHPKSELKNANDVGTPTLPESFTLDSSALDSNSNSLQARPQTLGSTEKEANTKTETEISFEREKELKAKWEKSKHKKMFTSKKLEKLGLSFTQKNNDMNEKINAGEQITDVISVIQFYFTDIATHHLSDAHKKIFEERWKPILSDIQSTGEPEKSQRLQALLERFLSFFNDQCKSYSQSSSLSSAFIKKITNENDQVKKKQNPILKLNAETRKHHLTRGVASILKYLAFDKELAKFLEQKFNLNLVKELEKASRDWRGELTFDLKKLDDAITFSKSEGLSHK